MICFGNIKIPVTLKVKKYGISEKYWSKKMKILYNKRGDGYVSTSVMIISLSLLLSVLIFFYITVLTVRVTKQNSKTVLNSFILKNSVDIYNSIKQGNDYIDFLDENLFITDLSKFCTLEKENNFLYHYDSDGKVEYRMSIPKLEFLKEKRLKLKLSYTLDVPLWFDGKIIKYATVNVTVKSALSEKF